LPGKMWGFEYPRPLYSSLYHPADGSRLQPDSRSVRLRAGSLPSSRRPGGGPLNHMTKGPTPFEGSLLLVLVAPGPSLRISVSAFESRRGGSSRLGGSEHSATNRVVRVRLSARGPYYALVPVDPDAGLRSRPTRFDSEQGCRRAPRRKTSPIRSLRWSDSTRGD